jgi:hypothetical protein
MKKKPEKREWFIVLGNEGYYKGLANGGKIQWTPNEHEAKPLDHLNKFKTLQTMCYNQELIYDYL